MGSIRFVNSDVDRVWHADISTTYAAMGHPGDYKPYLSGFLLDGLFNQDDVRNWVDNYNNGNELNSIGDLALMLTAFYNKMKKDDKPILSKDQTIKSKQSLLAGLTCKDVLDIAYGIEPMEGLKEMFNEFDSNGIYYIASSDGLGPVIHALGQKYRIPSHRILTVPAIVSYGKEEMEFDSNMLGDKNFILTGKSKPFKKGEVASKYAAILEYTPEMTAAIDDSSANLPYLSQLKMQGGLAVGFNVLPNQVDDFKKAGIPILKGKDLRRFAELVLDPERLEELTE